MRVEPVVPVLLPPVDGRSYKAGVLKGLDQTHVIFGEDALDARREPVWKSKFYGAFVPNLRVDLHAIDATPARWRGGVGSSPLDRARTAACTRRTG